MKQPIIQAIKEGISFRLISLALSIMPSGTLKKKLCVFIVDELFVPEKEFVHSYSLKDYRTIISLIDKEINQNPFEYPIGYKNNLQKLSNKTLFNIKNTIHKLHKNKV